MLKKPVVTEGAHRSGGPVCGVGELLKEYPHVYDFLTQAKWEDGSSRATGTILIFMEDHQLKACVHDRAVGRSAFVSGGTLDAVLEELELRLPEDTLDWRRKRVWPRGRAEKTS